MKLFAGIAISALALFGDQDLKRPEPFFVPHNVLSYSYSVTPTEVKAYSLQAVLEITKVTTVNQSAYSEGTLTYGSRSGGATVIYRVRFACDSQNYYVHCTNWLYEPVEPMKGVELKISGDSLWYPLNMKVGDTLRSATASEKYASPTVKDAYTVNFINRKVVAQDSLSTPSGKQVAFRIEMNVSYNSVYDSQEVKGRKKQNIEVSEWFVPAIGVVKSEYRDPSTGVTRISMDSYKK